VTGAVEVVIRVDDLQGPQAHSLYRWLTVDPQVVPDTTVSLAPEPAPPGAGEMGALEVVNVVLGNGVALGSLVVAVCSWRESRSRPPTVRIERDDVSVVIEDASPETVRRVIEALTDDGTP
jgi:predicted dehydrogenase